MRIVLIVGILATMVRGAESIQLVKGGQSAYAIVVRENASPSEKRGAKEIQTFVKQMSGAELPIKSEVAAPQENEIVVGVGKRAAEARVAPDMKARGDEG